MKLDYEDPLSQCCCAAPEPESDLCSNCFSEARFTAVFTLTPEQVTKIHDANFEPKNVIVGYTDTPARRAHIEWEKLAKELNFKIETLQPFPYEKGRIKFTAELESL